MYYYAQIRRASVRIHPVVWIINEENQTHFGNWIKLEGKIKAGEYFILVKMDKMTCNTQCSYRVWKFKIHSWFYRSILFFVTMCRLFIHNVDEIAALNYWCQCAVRNLTHKSVPLRSWENCKGRSRKRNNDQINYKCHFFSDVCESFVSLLLVIDFSHVTFVCCALCLFSIARLLFLFFLLTLCWFDTSMWSDSIPFTNGACVYLYLFFVKMIPKKEHTNEQK